MTESAATPRQYRIRTTQREFTILAESAEHAHDVITGRSFPCGVPPAPRPAEENYRDEHGILRQRETPAWSAWFREHQPRLWGERLAWQHGECLLLHGITEINPAGRAEKIAPRPGSPAAPADAAASPKTG